MSSVSIYKYKWSLKKWDYTFLKKNSALPLGSKINVYHKKRQENIIITAAKALQSSYEDHLFIYSKINMHIW